MDRYKSLFLYASAVYDVLSKADARLKSEPFQTSETVMADAIESLQEVENRAVASGEIDSADIEPLRTDIRRFINIARRAYTKDIRSIEQRRTQRNDFAENLLQVRRRWYSNIYVAKRSMEGAPSYRYKIGDVVSLASNPKKAGKVVGVHKEGGNGKQMYRVRMFDSDHEKVYSLKEIKLSK